MTPARSLLPAALTVLALILATPRPVAAQCMLANPSFEHTGSGTTFAGWTAFGPTGSSATALHGTRAARVTGPNDGRWDVSGYWQSLNAAPGQRFTVSVYVRNTSAAPLTGGSQALLNVEWHDASGNLIGYESHAVADAAAPGDTWQTYSVDTQAAPTGTATIHFLIGVLQGPTDATPQVLFDLARCVKLGTPTHESLQWNDFPSGRTLTFAGRTWRVKGTGYYGPGPNLFDSSSGGTWVDALGRLHLAIHKIGANWYSSEVVLADALGYGDYVFTTRGRLDLLDRNAVLGLFLWEYGDCYDSGYLWWNPYNEVDIEFSRWGNAANGIAQYVAQPADTYGNITRWNAAFGDSEVTSHAMRWLPGRVEYRSWRGGPDDESAATTITAWTYAGADLPRPEAPRVHLNLWQLAAPAVAQEAVFDAFTFRPACVTGTCGPLAVDPPAAAHGGPLLAAPAPNPCAGSTTFAVVLPASGVIELSVFDVGGRRVRRVAGGAFAAGAHTLVWDGRDEGGRRAAPGIYRCRLATRWSAESRTLVIVR